MKYIYSTSQISKLSLTLHTFSVTGSVIGLFLTSKSTRRTQRCADLWNNLGFSLYAMLSVCHVVATLDDREKSKMEVSANLMYCH